MKELIVLLAFSLYSVSFWAQTEKEINLDEVVVNGAKVVSKVDGQRVTPTLKQLEASTSGYSLLKKLALPNIIVDEVMHTISSYGNLGEVQVRINDIPATKEDLLSLDMKSVKYIDYINNPGVRYGENVGFVINFVTARAVSGYVAGADLTQTMTSKRGVYDIYARFNHKKNEFGIDYDYSYQDFKGGRNSQTTEYLMQDNSIYKKTNQDTHTSNKNTGHSVRLHYNIVDSIRYVLQTTLSGYFINSPKNIREQDIITENSTSKGYRSDTERSSSPVLDIYMLAKLGKNQTLKANAVGTYISSDYSYFYDEMGKKYQHQGDGNTYSFISEAIYENAMKPFTLSAGMQFQQKYVSNKYSGDINTVVNERTSNLYLFGQINGSIAKLRYMAGVGVSRQYYRQSSSRYDYVIFRPKLTVSYPLFRGANIKYDLSIRQHPPRPEYISDVRIQSNELDIIAGNPNLKPAHRSDHRLTLSYQTPRLYTEINANYSPNIHPVMQQIYRDGDKFVFTRANQKSIHFMYLQNYTRYDIIPDKLSATVFGGVFRCMNYGNTYKHHYTSFSGGAYLTAYVGNFTFQAMADNGFRVLEGETKIVNGGAYYVTASYKLGNINFSLYYQHCLQKNPLQEKTEIMNEYVNRTFTSRSRDLGNMLSLNISINISKGRKYKEIERTMKNSDKDTGIKMTGN